MSGFSPAWLALREPADLQARDAALERTLAAALARSLAPTRRGTVAVDLACGTGANLRRLGPRLPGPQRWRLLDADAGLLTVARERCSNLRAADGSAIVVDFQSIDLSRAGLHAVCDGAQLVTASALLDLVSAEWLNNLVGATLATGACALFALDYDGRRVCEPLAGVDRAAHAAFDAHQHRDKGFGPALGPAAASFAAAAFEAQGYRVQRARSDWVLEPGQAALQRELLHGWAAAAIEHEPDAREQHAAWLQQRLAHVAAGRSRLRVGHEDLLALPD